METKTPLHGFYGGDVDDYPRGTWRSSPVSISAPDSPETSDDPVHHLGTDDLERSARFYDDLLAGLGASRVIELERMIGWAIGPQDPVFSVIKPYDGESASTGNGVMIALHVDEPAKVDALHRRALELGGHDEGAPGLRFGTFYAAYFRDLDGHKVALVRM